MEKRTVFNDNIPKAAVKFWCVVFEYENQMKEHSFLASCCLVCLATLMSNTFVETIFSSMTNVKIKQRKRISVKMLEALLRIRTH